MALNTMMAVGMALSAASGVAQYTQAEKAAKAQEDELKRQETIARNAAKADVRREDTGADIAIGVDDEEQLEVGAAKTKKKGQVLGGVSTSKRIGI